MTAAAGVIAAAGGFRLSQLDPVIIFDHTGIGATQWVPSYNPQGWATPTGGSGTLTTNWLGTGKSAVNYGSSRVTGAVAGVAQPCRTYAFVGRMRNSLGAATGFTSDGDTTQKRYPFYADSASSGTIGCDFFGGSNNRPIITGINPYLGLPFVCTISAESTTSFRACFLCNGAVLTGQNTTFSQISSNWSTNVTIGGWVVSGGNWSQEIASMSFYNVPVGASKLRQLAEYWATKYTRSNF